MAQPTPDPDRDRPFPWEHEHDLERPGVTIRPLSHADLAALLAQLEQGQQDELTSPTRDADGWPAGIPAPVVAVRVRATVGRPGGSAQAAYHRRRAVERAGWARTLPLRLAGVLAAAAGAALLADRLAPGLGVAAGALTAAGVGWALRFRPSPEARAWHRGAQGERRTARLLGRLERHGWTVLHDLAVPGSRANIDHLAIGPAGVVVVVVDSKQYSGRLQLDPYGNLWHGRHLLTTTLRAARWEADQADEVLGVADVDVAAVVAVHGASVPWGGVTVDGVTVLPAGRVPDLLRALPVVLGPERVAWLADRARGQFQAAA